MDRTTLREHLALAEQSVREGVRHIERQRQLIDQLRRAGHDNRTAQELLRSFEQSQSTHLAKRDRLRQELEESQT
jgi:hypothetical protein